MIKLKNKFNRFKKQQGKGLIVFFIFMFPFIFLVFSIIILFIMYLFGVFK